MDSLMQKLFTRGLTHNYYIFLTTYNPNTTAAPRRHRLTPKERPRHTPPDITTTIGGPVRFRSLDFDERNGYLKGPARFCSLNFGERNGYLKGVAPIDAQ